jgi:hypothetical protein
MNDDILEHPKVKALLREADSALALLREVGDDDPGNFQAALTHIYADLGRTIHELVPSDAMFDDDEVTAVDEVMPEGTVDDGQDDDPTDPRVTPLVLPPKTKGLAGRGMGSTPARKSAKKKRAADRRSAAARTAATTPPPPPRRATKHVTTPGSTPLWEGVGNKGESWIEQLGDLLEALALPFEMDSPEELAAEASLVQWSTVGLDEQWAPFPPAIQAALLGLIVSRARHLQNHLEVHVGPRLALERLGAYRTRVGLSKVEGLYPERQPQTGSWAEDARQWWETLLQGLRTA